MLYKKKETLTDCLEKRLVAASEYKTRRLHSMQVRVQTGKGHSALMVSIVVSISCFDVYFLFISVFPPHSPRLSCLSLTHFLLLSVFFPSIYIYPSVYIHIFPCVSFCNSGQMNLITNCKFFAWVAELVEFFKKLYNKHHFI